MKKYLFLISLLISPMAYGGIRCNDCDCNIIGHSFFSCKPLYQSASPERVTLFHDRVHAREMDGWAGAIQLEIFGSKTKNPSQLAAFFGPSCKTQYTVTSANTTCDAIDFINNSPTERDIVAQFFNIYFRGPRVFESTFCLDPEQTMVGVGISYKQGVYERYNGKWFWIELSSPLTHVKNQMCIHETIKADGELLSLDCVGSISEAFRQSTWNYGRIDPCCNHTETKFADLELKVGYEWLKNDCCFMESYIGALIPTGNRVTSRILFEPIIGHNKHPGILTGSSGIFEWWRNEEKNCYAEFAFDWNCLYLFEKVEMRSFDLNGRPWSRYMPVYRSEAEALQAADLVAQERVEESILLYTPGINVFTKPLCIKPGFAHTFNTAFLLTCKNVQGEVGYNIFARNTECVRLACCWEEGPALKSIEGRGYTIDPRVQTIDNAIVGHSDSRIVANVDHYNQNIITECDLDLESAAHPAMIIHTVYGSLGYRWDDRNYPCFIGTGFSYEFASDNAGVDRWVAWLKGGVSF